MNRFLHYPPPGEYRPTSRLYARLDDAMGTDTSRTELLFGAVDAEWFDDPYNRAGLLAMKDVRLRAIDDLPVYFLEVDVFFQGGSSWVIDGKNKFEGDRWVEIELTKAGDARLYPNLYGDAQPVTIMKATEVPAELANDLSKVHSLDEWTVSDEDLLAYLGGLRTPQIEQCAVYDVGQGAANSFSESICIPTVYFDFGGGSRGHSKTRPHTVPHFCLTNSPPIILSHWHDDHWSSGPLVAASLKLTWIAPYQSVSGPHLTLVGAITAPGKLMVTRMTSFSLGNASFHRATGKSINNSGFWATVSPPSDGEPFFFPSDASYRDINGMPSVVEGIAATHHGANWKHATLPPTARGSGSKAVFSFGNPNTYGHPTSRSTIDHSTKGFVQFDTPLPTGGASKNGTGHVHLDWAGAPLPTAPCGMPNCYQNLDQ